jgi:outer membrane biogenesis lipoprotein LolB
MDIIMRIQHLFLLTLTIIMLTACSGDTSDKKETVTEKMTREVAEKAVEHIKDPINKAHEAAALAEKHNQQIQINAQSDQK